MNTTDPYTALRQDLTGQPPIGEPLFPPGHPDAPPQVPPAPAGAVWTMLPNGERVLAYLPPGYEKTTDAPPPGAAAGPAGRDKWPLRMLTGGASTAMVLGVVGHYGPGLNQAGHAAEMAGIGVAATAAGLGALVALVKGSMGSKQPISVNVNVSNTNSSTSTSRSRSNHRNH